MFAAYSEHIVLSCVRGAWFSAVFLGHVKFDGRYAVLRKMSSDIKSASSDKMLVPPSIAE